MPPAPNSNDDTSTERVFDGARRDQMAQLSVEFGDRIVRRLRAVLRPELRLEGTEGIANSVLESAVQSHFDELARQPNDESLWQFLRRLTDAHAKRRLDHTRTKQWQRTRIRLEATSNAPGGRVDLPDRKTPDSCAAVSNRESAFAAVLRLLECLTPTGAKHASALRELSRAVAARRDESATERFADAVVAAAPPADPGPPAPTDALLAGLRRVRLVLLTLNGRPVDDAARLVGCSPATAYRDLDVYRIVAASINRMQPGTFADD